MRRAGVDVGGTFTDIMLWDDEVGRAVVHKLPSTPADPANAMTEGLRELCASLGSSTSDLDQVLHGTTVATNAVLEREGSEVGMITTEGFRDLIYIGRHRRPHTFSIYQDLPWREPALASRANRLTVRERVVAPDGDVLEPLDEDAVRAAARRLNETGVESVAVCFLFSFLNPEHERRAAEIVREELPDTYLSVSHEVVPLHREYERFSTTCLNAYIGPRVSRYLARMRDAMAADAPDTEFHLMASNGGVVTVDGAIDRPVSLLVSGRGRNRRGHLDRPGGRRRERDHARRRRHLRGHRRCAGRPVAHEAPLRHLDRRLRRDAADGRHGHDRSGRRLDRAHRRRWSPTHGPAERRGGARAGVLRRGGAEVTATDAQVALGRLRPETFLGGRMRIDPDAAVGAVERLLTGPLGLSIDEAAMGVVRVLDHNMVRAIELNSVRKGYDPASSRSSLSAVPARCRRATSRSSSRSRASSCRDTLGSRRPSDCSRPT